MNDASERGLRSRAAIRPFIILFALALSFVTAAPERALADSNCVFMQTISGFNAISDSAIIIYTGPRTAYRVDVAGYCTGLRHTETIAIDSRDGRLCWPSNNHILTSDGGRCLVTSVLRMARDAPKPAQP